MTYGGGMPVTAHRQLPPAPPPPEVGGETNPCSAGAYGIFKHGVAVLGYSVQLSVIGMLQIIGVSALAWEREPPAGATTGLILRDIGEPRFRKIACRGASIMCRGRKMGTCGCLQRVENILT